MDPLSITASTIAILQLTTSVISAIRGPDREKVADEVIRLTSLLLQLQQYVVETETDSQTHLPWLGHIGSLKADLAEIQKRLEQLTARLPQQGSRRTTILRLRSELEWRAGDRHVRELLSEVERIKNTVSTALALRTV